MRPERAFVFFSRWGWRDQLAVLAEINCFMFFEIERSQGNCVRENSFGEEAVFMKFQIEKRK